MSWTAFIPLKSPSERKRRLAVSLSAADRLALSERLFAHVLSVVEGVRRIERVVLVSAVRPADWQHGWQPDRGRGLNRELADSVAAILPRRVLLLHADLPLLGPQDVAMLLDAAEQSGLALAPDRHKRGTNALAIADGRPFMLHFGPDSLSRHLAEGGARTRLVETEGLATDCDTPQDLGVAVAAGLRLH